MGEYHIRRKDREITDDKEITRILKTGKYATIAMAMGNDPYVVTLSYGYDEASNSMYFHCANIGKKIDYINANPRVCATIIEDNGYVQEKCEHHFSSLIISGNMDILKKIEDKEKGLRILMNHLEPDPQPIYDRNIKGPDSYNKVTVLRLRIDSITGKKGQ